MRLFIAVDTPLELSTYFRELQEKIKEFDADAKLTYPKSFHVTLKFLGDVDESKAEQVKKLLKNIVFSPFVVNFLNVGYFDEKKLRVIWAGIEDFKEILFDLQKDIDKNLIYLFSKEKNFVSHITLARVKKIENSDIFKEKIKNLEVEQKEFKVSSFKLFKSDLQSSGPVYELLEEYS